jgi:YVTN family beta-propeller protein
MINQNYYFLKYFIIFIFSILQLIILFNPSNIFSEISQRILDDPPFLKKSEVYFDANFSLAKINQILLFPKVIDIEIDSTNNFIYAVYSKDIYIHNGNTKDRVGHIALDGFIWKIAISPENNRVYVANVKIINNNQTFVISVIDSNTTKVIDDTIIPTGYFNDMSLDVKTNTLYLSDYSNGNIYSLDYANANNKPIINSIKIPKVLKLDVNPINHKIYSIIGETSKISLIEPNLTHKNISVARIPNDLTINPRTNMVYIVNNDNNRISVIDAKTDQVIKTISLSLEDRFPNFPKSLAIDSNTNLIYLSSYKSVFIIDDKTNELLLEIPIGFGLLEVDVNPNKNLIYVTDKNEGIIHIFNGTLNNIMKAVQNNKQNKYDFLDAKNFGISAIPSPKEITVNHKTGKLYAIDDSSGKIFVIDERTEKILDQLYIVNSPSKLAVNTKNNIIFILDDNKIYSLDGTTNRINFKPLVINSSLTLEPKDITINEQKNLLYITYKNASKNSILYVIDAKDNDIINSLSFSGGGNVEVDEKENLIYLQKTDGIIILNQLQNGTIGKNRDNILINGIVDFDFDSLNKNLHIISDNKTYYIVDVYTGNIQKKSLIYEPSKIATDPLNNRGYILNFPFDSFTLINNLDNPSIMNINLDLPFIGSYDSFNINPKTNKIFITSAESGMISVLNESSNKLTTGITYSINPPNLGFIECNKEKITDILFKKYDKDTTIECEAKPNSGALFQSWSGNFNLTSPSNQKLNVEASHYGNITANFKEEPVAIDFKIPFDTMLQIFLIVIAAIIGWLIPSIFNGINNLRFRTKRNQYLEMINNARDTDALKGVYRAMLNDFAQNNLNSLNYKYLNDIIKEKLERL